MCSPGPQEHMFHLVNIALGLGGFSKAYGSAFLPAPAGKCEFPVYLGRRDVQAAGNVGRRLAFQVALYDLRVAPTTFRVLASS